LDSHNVGDRLTPLQNFIVIFHNYTEAGLWLCLRWNNALLLAYEVVQGLCASGTLARGRPVRALLNPSLFTKAKCSIHSDECSGYAVYTILVSDIKELIFVIPTTWVFCAAEACDYWWTL